MEKEPSLRFSSNPDNDREPYFWLNLHKGRTRIGRCRLGFHSGNCFLGSVIIYSRYRRKGYGNILINEAIKDNPSVMLWVKPENTPARNLYEKHGFVLIGSDHNGLIMVKKDKPLRFKIEVGNSMELVE